MDRVCVQGLVSTYLVTFICGRKYGVREMKAKGSGYLVGQQAFWWDDLTCVIRATELPVAPWGCVCFNEDGTP